MSDRFHPISMEQLTDWVFTELEQKGSLFNVPRSAFFVPRPDHRFRTPRLRGGAGDAVRRGGRAAHPDGPEHRRGVARRRPPDRAQDDPDPRRARRQQALHRRPGRGLQRRVVAGAQGPPVVRRVPAGLGADPRPPPQARLARRAPGRGLQHERRVQPRGHPASRTCSGTSTRWPTRRPTCRPTSRSSPGATRRSARSTFPAACPTRSRCRRCTAARPTRSRGSRSTCSRSAASTPRSSATRRCWAPSGCGASSTTTWGSRTCRSPTRPSGTTCR